MPTSSTNSSSLLPSAIADAIASDPRAAAWAAFLKEHYLDKGLLGREWGQGFYPYR